MPDHRISVDTMISEMMRILQKYHVAADKAESSLDGVYSHGYLRFPRFIDYIKKGYVKIDADPTKTTSLGALEQWDGQLGPGILNALFAADRAMDLADQFGIGCVAMANTNHWMRGGSYGWHAAKKGYAFIGWTNTTPNMPAWGAAESRLGNNPLVMALPFGENAIVLDMAMTQFSYGKLDEYKINGERLPFPGGFDASGELSDDPAAILDTMRGLPIGYWKGAGLSLLFDLLASTLSHGDSTTDVGHRDEEYGVSQVFIVFNLKKLPHADAIQNQVRKTINYVKASPTLKDSAVLYPGERVLKTRRENLKHGIPVSEHIWHDIQML